MTGGRRDADVARAVAEVAAGHPVVVLDDEDREAEGDLVLAASAATPEWLAFFVRHGTGLVCVPMTGSWADRLGLPLMVADNEESMRTAFTVTVDARHGLGTGVSASDRARTALLLAEPSSTAEELVRPGHLLPLRARPGGVLERRGHTEAAVDLARLAGRTPVGLIVELVDEDGSMRRAASCRAFAAEHGLAVVTVEQLARHLRRDALPSTPPPATASGVRRVATTVLPTAGAEFTAHGYRDSGGAEHLALVLGDVTSEPPVPVRVHSECLTGDVLGSLRCDCGPQLAAALATVTAEGRGVVVYLRGHEGRGIGLAAKLAAYALQDAGRDTVEANEDLGLPVDARDFRTAAQVLTDLGVGPVRLLTNNPAKVDALSSAGVRVVARGGLLVPPTAHNERYLRTKQQRLGHHLPQLDEGHRPADEGGTPR